MNEGVPAQGELDLLREHAARLERENRRLNLKNFHLRTAMERSAKYNLTKDRLIEVITAEKTKQEKFLGRLLETSPDIIVTLDREHRFVNCTDAFLHLADIASFGLIKNRTFFDVFGTFAPEIGRRMRDAVAELWDREETVVMMADIGVGCEDKPRHYEIHITPMFEGGEPDGMILLLIDITNLVRAKDELQVANAAMRDLVANISHDLKTPLTIMSVNLEELFDLARNGNDKKLLDKAEAAWRKNLDLQRITQNLFEVNRIETGRSIYNPLWFPLSALMLEIREKYEAYLEGRGLYLDTGFSDEADVWLDRQRIWSVFDNIVYNAARYTDEGGISVTAASGDDTAIIEVRDTGAGIASAHLPHIFERFYKVSDARGETDGDSGLGLYIARNVMQALGGGVAAESEPNRGTSIILTFKKRA